MALIKCSECGKEFSDKANACPNCACPNDNIIKNKSNLHTKKIDKKIIILGSILIIGILTILIITVLDNREINFEERIFGTYTNSDNSITLYKDGTCEASKYPKGCKFSYYNDEADQFTITFTFTDMINSYNLDKQKYWEQTNDIKQTCKLDANVLTCDNVSYVK